MRAASTLTLQDARLQDIALTVTENDRPQSFTGSAYAAWGDLPWPPLKGKDDLAPYRATTPELVTGFQARRLEAMERVAKDFRGNKQTEKTSFDLPDLAVFEQKARTLAHEERDQVRDVLGLADALHRDLRPGALDEVVEGDAHAVGGGINNAFVGLVRYQPGNVVAG